MNETNPEETTLARGENREVEIWRNVKKLGSLIGDCEDIARRKQLAIAASKQLEDLWI